MWLSPLVEGNLVIRRIVVEKSHVVYVKAVFEASEGLGAVFAVPRALRRTRSSEDDILTVAAPGSREADVDELLFDLKSELGAAMCVLDAASAPGGSN